MFPTDYSISSPEFGALVGETDITIARLARQGILTRVPDPADKRHYRYPLRENVRAYVAFLKTKAERTDA